MGARSLHERAEPLLPELGCAERVRHRGVVLSAECLVQPDGYRRRARLLGGGCNRQQVHSVSRAADVMRLLLLMLLLPLSAVAQPSGVQSCAGCHGAQGEGNATNGTPRIAGQPQAYLERQLAAYADGRRDNEVMTPIARQLAPEQRTALSAYYSDTSRARRQAPGGRPSRTPAAARSPRAATRRSMSRAARTATARAARVSGTSIPTWRGSTDAIWKRRSANGSPAAGRPIPASR